MVRTDTQSRSSTDDHQDEEVATLGQTPGPPPDHGAPNTDPPHRWEIIRDEIVREILGGTYPPGSLLPSNAQIQQRWGVSSTTSRKVLSELADAGWARSQGTRGYIATAGPQAQQYRTADNLRGAQGATIVDPQPHLPASHAHDAQDRPAALPRPAHTVPLAGGIAPILTTVTNVSVQPEPAPSEVAHALTLPGPGAPVLVRRHVLTDSTGRIPVELWAAYLPPDLPGDGPLAKPEPITATWPQALSTHTAHSVTTASSHIRARRPDPYEAHALNLSTADIVLIRATTFYAEGKPISHAISVWPADSTQLSAESHSVT
ncbi:GntR family transcriptional regulator [Actinomadura sp. SCN-SB]|uniref:GntR family transcriptional regulator n=1 Tax=Actinomadura sp. SCN-SB TaxID=3373092 RepID=UPI003750EB97